MSDNVHLLKKVNALIGSALYFHFPIMAFAAAAERTVMKVQGSQQYFDLNDDACPASSDDEAPSSLITPNTLTY